MTDHTTPASGADRLPDWWRTKPTTLPNHTTPDPAPEGDWWDALYADDLTDEGADAETTDSDDDEPAEEDDPIPPPTARGRFAPQPGYYPRPRPPAVFTQAPQRIALSHRTRAGLYNAGAAGAGWALGLYDPLAATLADCGQQSTPGALTLGIGSCLLIAHVWDRRTRHWWPGIAWAARIPLATAVLALALWAPAA
ncbi:hypothetical protein ABZ650_20500 [Streptomyces griseoviridis]|uniref:hypothetical protein n=1 Tax=Streptomyces griseoviridis TaxID=45398 RepID=UPI0033F430BF